MGVILMLMTVGGLIFASVLLIISRIKKISWLKHFVWGGLTVWIRRVCFFIFLRVRFQPGKNARR